MQEKFAVLSMDVEDWYHTGYLREEECVKGHSMLDGLDRFAEILSRRGISGELFVLADLLSLYPERFLALYKSGFVLSSHGRSHIPPLHLSHYVFKDELRECIDIHKRVIGSAPEGFRAARFMIDRERLDLVRDAGFMYDSSLIYRRQHAAFDLRGFTPISKHILKNDGFFEFRPASFQRAGMHWPTAGGGAMRILPWWMTAFPLKLQSATLELYSFYLHPIDISAVGPPPLPENTGLLTKARMRFGKSSMPVKLENLIDLLTAQGFQFTTYRALRRRLTA